MPPGNRHSAAFNAAVESGDYEALLTALYSFRDPLAFLWFRAGRSSRFNRG